MSGYIGNTPIPQATQTRDSFTATASQTSFATGGYTPNFLDVYLNGLKLNSSQFTATNGTDVVLTSAASSGDIVEVIAYTAFEVADASFDDLALGGDLTVGGTVDGRDIAADGTKLDGIESGATGDQTNAEIRAAVEAATDSNVFTDADHTKLNAIEASATADQTASEIRTLVESATDSNVFTDADHTKLNAIESGATADQTKSDIDALNINADTLDGQHGSYYTGYADTAVANIVDSAPGTLDTLNELAAALGDDPNFATTTATNIAAKLPLAGGTMTGTIAGFESTGIDDNASSTAMTLDASGNAIFTKSGGAYLQLKDASAVRGSINVTTSDGLIFTTGSSFTERMRIDSSGNLLVGKTSADFGATVGMEMRSNDTLYVARSGGGALALNRLSSDGDIAEFRKDGSTVGSIGAKLGGLYIADGGVGLRFDSGGTDDILPSNNTGSAADASINLGSSGARFKDLYLSGDVDTSGVFKGTNGTASAPTHSFLNDPDNGMFRPTTNTVGFSTAGSEAMRIDSSGNVGIGATPSSYLNVGYVLRLDGGAQTYLAFNNNTHTTQVLGGFVIGNDSGAARITQREDQPIIFATNNSDRMSISSSGDILAKTIDARIGSDVGAIEYGTSTDNSVRFYSNNTERMRITSSGNLLVGTTNTNPAENNVNGISLYNDGRYFGGTTSNEAMRLNRKSTDGDILIFHKDGTTVGSIAANGGSIIVGSGDTGLYFDAASDRLIPVNPATASGRDNAVNLGGGSERFKDVYAVNYYGDGSNLTGVGGSTTYGAVGTYLFAFHFQNNGTISGGATKAGSTLGPAGLGWNTGGDGNERSVNGGVWHGVESAPSGTWRFMSSMTTNISGRYPGGIWVRIS